MTRRVLFLPAALLLLIVGIVSACTVVVEQPPPPRGPQVCTMEHRPVCGQRGDRQRTFSNACLARARLQYSLHRLAAMCWCASAATS